MEKGLKINVNSLAADPVAVFAELDPRLFELGSEGRWLEPIRVQVKVHRLGEKVYIRGQVETAAELFCSRCLRELVQPVQSPLVLLAIPANQVVGHPLVADRAEGTDADDSVGIAYAGDQVDLTPEIQSVLTLALPMNPYARKHAKVFAPNAVRGWKTDPAAASQGRRKGLFRF